MYDPVTHVCPVTAHVCGQVARVSQSRGFSIHIVYYVKYYSILLIYALLYTGSEGGGRTVGDAHPEPLV